MEQGEWTRKALLFVMPGGADIPYCRKLNGQANRHIDSFVRQGGAYLGICAGAYFASAGIEFDLGGELEVIGPRELKFFPGKVIGPVFQPFAYNSHVGARSVYLNTDLFNYPIPFFYQGGGHFCIEKTTSTTQILARYSKTDQAAIVLCKVGQGLALLSGVHFEFEPRAVPIPLEAEILRKHSEERSIFVKDLLCRLFAKKAENQEQSN